jgi:hypothetical protein
MNPDLSAPLTHEEFVSLRDCAKGFDAPDNPSRTQRPTDPTRVHTGIVGRTSTNERWQAEDCGRQMTDEHPKRPRNLEGPLWRLRRNTAQMSCTTSPLDVPLHPNLGVLAQRRGRLPRQAHKAPPQARRLPLPRPATCQNIIGRFH